MNWYKRAQHVMGEKMSLVESTVIDTILYELYYGDHNAAIRVYDTESEEVIHLLKYQDLSKAKSAYDLAVKRAHGVYGETRGTHLFKEAQKLILITPAEKIWAEWAIDPMFDYWCSEEGAWDRGEDEVYDISDLPRVQGNSLTLSNILDINEDLFFRLKEQAPSVCETMAISEQQIVARCRAPLSLARKIRQVL
jgi:hypothetical protein